MVLYIWGFVFIGCFISKHDLISDLLVIVYSTHIFVNSILINLCLILLTY